MAFSAKSPRTSISRISPPRSGFRPNRPKPRSPRWPRRIREPGSTVDGAAADTGLDSGVLGQIVEHIGGEGALGQFAGLLGGEGGGIMDKLGGLAGGLFGGKS